MRSAGQRATAARYLPWPPRWGVGVCTGPASKSELFGNRSVPQRRMSVARGCLGDFLPPSPPAEKAAARQDQVQQLFTAATAATTQQTRQSTATMHLQRAERQPERFH
jgi:hypothetical protein